MMLENLHHDCSLKLVAVQLKPLWVAEALVLVLEITIGIRGMKVGRKKNVRFSNGQDCSVHRPWCFTDTMLKDAES